MMSVEDFSAKQVLFLVTKEQEKLSFRNDNIIIKNKDGKIIHQSTCYRLFALFIVGHFTITSGLIQRARKFGFAIIMMTTSFRPYQIISNMAEGNVLLRQKQYTYQALGAARSLVQNKLENQRFLLMQCRNKSEDQLKAIALLDEYKINIQTAESVRSIMGTEGSASRIYFKAYFDNVIWKGRKPRIKFDITNALLDIGYTILFCYMDALAAVFGFDRYNGFLHRQFYMRKSLVCDLVEPFRCIIDKQVKKGINLGQFKEKDFEIYDGKWCLKYKKSSDYSAIFVRALMDYKEEMFLYVRDVYRVFMKNKQETDMPYWRME